MLQPLDLGTRGSMRIMEKKMETTNCIELYRVIRGQYTASSDDVALQQHEEQPFAVACHLPPELRCAQLHWVIGI